MLKNIIKIEFIINDRVCTFLFENDMPLDHVKEALFQCQKYIGQIEDSIRSQIDNEEKNKLEKDKLEKEDTEVK